MGIRRFLKQFCTSSITLSQLTWYGFSSPVASSTYFLKCIALTLEGLGAFPFFNRRPASTILLGSGTTSSISKRATNTGILTGVKAFENSLIQSFVTFLRSSQDEGSDRFSTVTNQQGMILHASLRLPSLSSVSASASVVAAWRFLSSLSETFKLRVRRRYSVILVVPGSLRNTFFWSTIRHDASEI